MVNCSGTPSLFSVCNVREIFKGGGGRYDFIQLLGILKRFDFTFLVSGVGGLGSLLISGGYWGGWPEFSSFRYMYIMLHMIQTTTCKGGGGVCLQCGNDEAPIREVVGGAIP